MLCNWKLIGYTTPPHAGEAMQIHKLGSICCAQQGVLANIRIAVLERKL